MKSRDNLGLLLFVVVYLLLVIVVYFGSQSNGYKEENRDLLVLANILFGK